MDSTYLNCGVFIMRSPDTLDEWFRLSADIEIHALFEQNVFNLLAYRNFPRVEELDVDVWNAHDLALNELEVIRPEPHGPFRVLNGGKEVLVVHATSYQGRTLDFKPIRVPLGNGRHLAGLFRYLHNEAVHLLFLEMISLFIVQNRDMLLESGLGG